MKWLTRWLNRIALSTDTARALFARASDAIREARTVERESERALTLAAEELQYQRMRLSERMNDMLELRLAEVACVNPGAAKRVAESWKAGETTASVAVFKERLWELELALEDRGWVREQTLASLEFSRYGVGQLIRITRIYGIKNPLIKRGAEICALYVFGRGVEIRSENDAADNVIQDFIARNKAEMGHVGLAQKETSAQTDGNLYFGMETKSDGTVSLHMIDALEIMDVVTDPDDTSRDWYFQRSWNRVNFTPEGGQQPEQMWCWYPSVELAMKDGASRPKQIQGKPVNWDMPILRVKLGCPAKWHWGIPPLYASIDWGRAYKDFLEDWATVQRTLARFALMVETKGGPGAIAAYEALLSTTFADANGTQIEKNPPPVVGSAHVSGPDNKITAFKSAGAQVAPEQARRLMLMVAAAQGMPETFYGDASTGSLATAVSLDRPTELKFREIQERWKDTITRILQYVLWVSGKTPGSKMREARQSNPAPQEPVIIVHFPAVLEHDVGVMVKAWADVATLGGRQGIAAGIVDRRTVCDGMLAEVGYERRSELLDQIYGTDYDPGEDVIDQRTQAAPQNISGDDPNTSNDPETKQADQQAQKQRNEALVLATATLREALLRKNGRH